MLKRAFLKSLWLLFDSAAPVKSELDLSCLIFPVSLAASLDSVQSHNRSLLQICFRQ